MEMILPPMVHRARGVGSLHAMKVLMADTTAPRRLSVGVIEGGELSKLRTNPRAGKIDVGSRLLRGDQFITNPEHA